MRAQADVARRPSRPRGAVAAGHGPTPYLVLQHLGPAVQVRWRGEGGQGCRPGKGPRAKAAAACCLERRSKRLGRSQTLSAATRRTQPSRTHHSNSLCSSYPIPLAPQRQPYGHGPGTEGGDLVAKSGAGYTRWNMISKKYKLTHCLMTRAQIGRFAQRHYRHRRGGPHACTWRARLLRTRCKSRPGTSSALPGSLQGTTSIMTFDVAASLRRGTHPPPGQVLEQCPFDPHCIRAHIWAREVQSVDPRVCHNVVAARPA